MIHQQRKKFPENISDDEHQTQHRDRKQYVDQQLAAKESVDQLHFAVHTLAQNGSERGAAAFGRRSVPALPNCRYFANINAHEQHDL
jgi:hypothetical protein